MNTSMNSSRRSGNPLWRPAIGLSLFGLLGTGLVYAALATGISGSLFPAQADGSLIRDADGQVRGSLYLAQPFVGDGYFQTRPSAANYDPMAAAGSNMARSNPDLNKRVDTATAAVAMREKIDPATVPVARVARARGWPEARVQTLVAVHTQNRQWGVFGQPRINIVALNRALDQAAYAP
jgi:K+-transporting ATPase ATPase C chain